jgi:3-deoxy-7-phosphoheptulonate synthase
MALLSAAEATDGKESHPGDTSSWTPSSWKSKPIKQSPSYDDQKQVEKSLAKLNHLPPLVPFAEIDRLKDNLRKVAQGDAFLLQGGDCAELFDYCSQDGIESKMKLLLQMSLVLIWGSHKPIVRIARMAGQYAKPRSSPMEVVDGKEIPSFRGDILNGFKTDERTLDPTRLVEYGNYFKEH